METPFRAAMRKASRVLGERGQSTIFFASFVLILAVPAASRVDISQYRKTGQILFRPDVYACVQGFASANSIYLANRSIPVSVCSIRLDDATRVVAVRLTAHLSPRLQSLLRGGGVITVTGSTQARLDGRLEEGQVEFIYTTATATHSINS
jgi:hypothetical protein